MDVSFYSNTGILKFLLRLNKYLHLHSLSLYTHSHIFPLCHTLSCCCCGFTDQISRDWKLLDIKLQDVKMQTGLEFRVFWVAGGRAFSEKWSASPKTHC